eukprot:183541-Rhodomonas_salina.1
MVSLMMRKDGIALALIFACLFHVAIAGNRHLLAEEDDHDHDDHAGENGYEWIGKTALQTGTYTMVLSKVDGNYVDNTMSVLFLKVGDDWVNQLDTLKKEATEIMVHGLEESGCAHAGHDHGDHEDDHEEDHDEDHADEHDHDEDDDHADEHDHEEDHEEDHADEHDHEEGHDDHDHDGEDAEEHTEEDHGHDDA